MNRYQLYTRLRHAIRARHWRGHGVHSPLMYRFVREVAMPVRRRQELPTAIATWGAAEWRIVTVESVAELTATEVAERKTIVLLREPFRSADERRTFEAWFAQTHVVAAHLQGLLVLFLDPKLQKQFFRIRS
ncbi:MAG: hypothetical protein K2G93_06390 [Rikenella sp.]|nr:hypothetical protein [Rikenella sp.]